MAPTKPDVKTMITNSNVTQQEEVGTEARCRAQARSVGVATTKFPLAAAMQEDRTSLSRAPNTSRQARNSGFYVKSLGIYLATKSQKFKFGQA